MEDLATEVKEAECSDIREMREAVRLFGAVLKNMPLSSWTISADMAYLTLKGSPLSLQVYQNGSVYLRERDVTGGRLPFDREEPSKLYTRVLNLKRNKRRLIDLAKSTSLLEKFNSFVTKLGAENTKAIPEGGE